MHGKTTLRVDASMFQAASLAQENKIRLRGGIHFQTECAERVKT
jgi:hypothetical protein